MCLVPGEDSVYYFLFYFSKSRSLESPFGSPQDLCRPCSLSRPLSLRFKPFSPFPNCRLNPRKLPPLMFKYRPHWQNDLRPGSCEIPSSFIMCISDLSLERAKSAFAQKMYKAAFLILSLVPEYWPIAYCVHSFLLLIAPVPSPSELSRIQPFPPSQTSSPAPDSAGFSLILSTCCLMPSRSSSRWLGSPL